MNPNRLRCGGRLLACLLLFPAVLLLQASGAAVQPTIPGTIMSFIEDSGLSRRIIFDLAFQADGVTWVAASDGLYRYDGYRWQRFSTAHGLPSNFVRAVLVTRAGTLWVGTDKGAGTFDGQRFDLRGNAETLAGLSVRRIAEDPDGTLWFCSDTWPDATIPGGITSLHAGVWHRYGRAEGVDPAHILNYFRTSDGRRYALCNGPGIFQFEGDRWVRAIFDSAFIWSMAETANGLTLAVSEANAYMLDRSGWRKTKRASPSFAPLLCGTRSGEIFMGGRTAGGLTIRRWNGVTFEPASPLIPSPALMFQVLREAPDGSIWGGCENLLIRWDRSTGEWENFPDLPSQIVPAGDGRVWFVGADHSVLADGDSLTRVDEVSGQAIVDHRGVVWSWHPHEIRRREGDRIETISAVEIGLDHIEGAFVDGAGAVWLHGSDDSGRPHASSWRNGAWRDFIIPCNSTYTVSDVVPDKRDGLWIVLSNSTPAVMLARLGTNATTLHPIEYGGARYFPPRLAVDPHTGGLWLYGCAGVLHCADIGAGRWTPVSGIGGNHVISAVVAGDRQWFVFDGLTGGINGLAIVRQGQTSQQTANVSGYSTLAGDNNVYVGQPGSLLVFHGGDPANFNTLALPRPDELVGLAPTSDSLWAILQNTAGEKSVWRYRPDRIPPATLVELGAPDVPARGWLQVRMQGIGRFSPRQSGRRFRFSWRIDHAVWTAFVPVPPDRISVLGLAPGPHRIEVRSQDEGFDIDPHPAVAEFRVLPVPLQERGWFRPLVIAVFGVIACLALLAAERARKTARANTRLRAAQLELQKAHDELEIRVQERTSQLEQQTEARHRAEGIVEERNRLGQELHDSLEQDLASVAMQLEAARLYPKETEQSSHHIDTARQLLRLAQAELHRSVHDLRSAALDARDLARALRLHLEQIQESTPIQFQFQCVGEARRLPTAIEHNLFRIVQEAVTNAIRHAGCSRIAIRLEFRSDAIALSVSDDGHGMKFDPAADRTGHFGLIGMRERASRLGARLHVDSSAAGTTVSVHVALVESSATIPSLS